MKSVSGHSGRQHLRIIALLAVPISLMALGACSKKPGGQVVAVVNNQEITQQELKAEAQTAPQPAGEDPQVANAALLQRVVDRNLLADYAREQGLDRGPEYVARRRLVEQALLVELALRKLAGTQADPTPAEAQAFVAANPTLYAQRQKLTLDQVRFVTPKDPAKAAALSKLATIDAIVAELKNSGMAFTRGSTVMDTGSVDPKVARQVLALSNAQVFNITAGGQTYSSAVVARESIPSSPNDWQLQATQRLKQARAVTNVETSMAKLRKSAKIEYDPAFKPKT